MDDRYTLLPTADGSRTLYSDQYQQTFHSHHGARSEAEHVYLGLCEVAARLQAGRPTRVLEVGFGAGLNALVTLKAAEQCGGVLHYAAAELAPLPATVHEELGYVQAIAPEWAAQWLDFTHALHQARPNTLQSTSLHSEHTGRTCARIEVWVGDAIAAPWPAGAAQAVYLDAFSPDQNPELWTVEFFRQLHAWAAPDALLSTYCCKGQVRRDLNEAGWSARRAQGPRPGKRTVLLAPRSAGSDEPVDAPRSP